MSREALPQMLAPMMRRLRLRRSLLAALLASAGACAAASPAGAVVNGTPVDRATVPWYANVGGCGGTLVAPDRVLTAAHCVAGLTPSQLGAVSVGGVTRTPTAIALHPNWRARNGDSFLDDVAIVGLDQPVTGVPIVTLGGAELGEARILGQGRPFAPGTGHSEASMYDSTLRTADLRVIGDRECAALFKTYKNPSGEKFDPRMRCAIDADGLEPLSSGCFGDSGGPLWTGTPDAPVQLGIVSWGGNCGADHRPSVFADVARYRDFITDPAPTWAPTNITGTARIRGTARPGQRLTCSVSGHRGAPGTTLSYGWSIVGAGTSHFGAPKPVGTGKTYTIRRADAGHHIACFVKAGNDGGYVTLAVANKAVRRAGTGHPS
jgi:hypothetical protein